MIDSGEWLEWAGSVRQDCDSHSCRRVLRGFPRFGGLIQRSSFSRYYLPIVTTEIYL